ncbi:MAG: class I SAM-dependent methyltransferase [Acidimicrobiales bacterium]
MVPTDVTGSDSSEEEPDTGANPVNGSTLTDADPMVDVEPDDAAVPATSTTSTTESPTTSQPEESSQPEEPADRPQWSQPEEPADALGGSRTGGAKAGGSEQTRRFYNELGWTETGGRPRTVDLFGTKEDGPIRVELHHAAMQRIHDAITVTGSTIDLLECGCGGTPELDLLDLCSHYTGVDFSETGIRRAGRVLADCGVDHELHLADVCDLPFPDARFDAVYAARMIYHIPDPEAQARALQEMLRVTKPGGVVVIITANPFPILFPERSLKRLIAITPGLGALANRLRPPPPLPYQPMTLPWFKRRIGEQGSVEMISSGLPSTAFNQRVSEYHGIGRRLWEVVRWIELTIPRAAVWLGNYTQITITKH